jgi:hypothetical protein
MNEETLKVVVRKREVQGADVVVLDLTRADGGLLSPPA